MGMMSAARSIPVSCIQVRLLQGKRISSSGLEQYETGQHNDPAHHFHAGSKFRPTSQARIEWGNPRLPPHIEMELMILPKLEIT